MGVSPGRVIPRRVLPGESLAGGESGWVIQKPVGLIQARLRLSGEAVWPEYGSV